MRVAVIGPEGLDTALVVAWLRRRGLEALGFTAPGPCNLAVGPHTDVFVPSASPATLRLTRTFGLAPARVPVSASFRRADGSTWLRSGPLGDRRRATPGLASLRFLSRDTLAVGVGLARLPASPEGLPAGLTLEAWLRRARLPAAFTSAFLLPILASALLLPPGAVATLPAAATLSLARALIDDTQLAVLPLGALGQLAAAEAGVLRKATAIDARGLIDATDTHHPADAIVLVTPTQPLEGLGTLPPRPLHVTPVRVHTDASFLPPDERDRAIVNYRVDGAGARVELTFSLAGPHGLEATSLRPLVTLGPLGGASPADLLAHRVAGAPDTSRACPAFSGRRFLVGADVFPALPPLEALAASTEAAISGLLAGS